MRTCSCRTSSSAHAAERSSADCRAGYAPLPASGDATRRGVDGGMVDDPSPQLESPTAPPERCGETTERRYAVCSAAAASCALSSAWTSYKSTSTVTDIDRRTHAHIPFSCERRKHSACRRLESRCSSVCSVWLVAHEQTDRRTDGRSKRSIAHAAAAAGRLTGSLRLSRATLVLNRSGLTAPSIALAKSSRSCSCRGDTGSITAETLALLTAQSTVWALKIDSSPQSLVWRHL